MRITRQSIIAGMVICLFLVILFIIYQIFLFQLEIIIENKSTIYLTPMNAGRRSNSTNRNNIDKNNIPIISEVISIGMHVHINNTGGDGLIIRALAGLDGKPLYLGIDEEEFEIIDGPMEIDNQTWWKIKSIVDPQKVGWAVQDYLLYKQ